MSRSIRTAALAALLLCCTLPLLADAQIPTPPRIPVVATEASLPTNARKGDLAQAADTGIVYVHGAATWAKAKATAYGVVNADVATGAAIARAKIATGTAYGVIVNDSSGALTSVAPSTSGNVLTSNGTSWASTAPATVQSGAVVQTDGTLLHGSSTVTSSTKNATGDYSVTLNTSCTYPASCACTAIVSNSVGGSTGFADVVHTSGTSKQVLTFSAAGAASDRQFTLVCHSI